MLAIHILAPFQTSFTIQTNSVKLLELLRLKHGNYVKSCNYPTNYTISVTEKGNLYEISSDSEIFTTDIPLRKIEDLMYEKRQYSKNIFAIHGGAVEYNGGAYLIVAATTSGKTTLTSYLSSNGFGYITDDCILIDRQSFEVYPFTTPIHLRGGGYSILQKLDCLPKELQLLDDVSIKRYVYTPKNRITRPLPLRKIFFITRTEHTDRIEKMSTTEKTTALLKSPITNYAINRDYLSFISKLAQVPCEKLYYSDMAYVSEVIKNG